MISFHCANISASPLAQPLIFDWDEETGTVSGPSADEIRRIAAGRGVSRHPIPSSHRFGPEPLKSRTDLAAIVGEFHQLPPELADAYPRHPDDDAGPLFVERYDEEGNLIERIECHH